MNKRARSACGLALLVLLCGCANGDFGRVKPSLVSDDTHSWVGREAARQSGFAVSTSDLTYDERELRDLAYTLIAPPYNRGKWDSIVYEYGIVPTRWPWQTSFDRAAYSRYLLDRSVRSPTARYSRLIDDIRNDTTQLTLFAAVARRVLDMDSKRSRSLAYVSAPSQRERDSARRRVAENSLVIAWVRRSLRERADGYQFALERIVIDTPSQMAVEAEQVLTLLRQQTKAAARG
jgi:hypothetical protein